MRISLLQTNIAWEDKEANLERLHTYLQQLCGKTDLIVLPEMFSTGFSMNSNRLAEKNDGHTVSQLTKWSHDYQTALTGSFIAKGDDGNNYNRGFFITPDGKASFYDKRHLFRMGKEPEFFAAGNNHLLVNYKGFHISLLICYDLRFPVWSRNVDNAYDLLIYVANWPASRRKVWDALLKARALENMSYVCGVNRVGTDGNALPHNGGSILISPKGDTLIAVEDNQEGYSTIDIDTESLQHFRNKFPVWKDADTFSIGK
jgi:predicted amidohydrolase